MVGIIHHVGLYILERAHYDDLKCISNTNYVQAEYETTVVSIWAKPKIMKRKYIERPHI